MSSEDLSSSSSIITPTAMQQRSHRLSRQPHVHHQVEIHDCIEDEEEEDEEEYIQPIVRRKDQASITQSRSKIHYIHCLQKVFTHLPLYFFLCTWH